MAASELELRCFCSNQPLLALAGRDASNRAYIHVRAQKNRQVLAEVIAHSGEIEIRCRVCLRMHRFTIRTDSDPVKLKQLLESRALDH